ncbi:MAG: LysR family transcriptional regulator [Gammaproteobacteria bacterium]|nr:MAG: LysR family transcriptional regulator [Gammaproteobacteria bacterium]
MRISHLKTFVTVADTGSFARAAERHGRTPSAISLQMKALEDSFGLELFDRTQRPPALNRYGHAILRRVRDIVALYEALQGNITSDELRGVLEIGAVPTMFTGILPRALAAYQSRYPRVQIRVVQALSAELVTRLAHGELDAALISEPPVLPQNLSWRAFAREPLVVIAPEDAPGKRDRDLLERFPYIRFNRAAWVGQTIEEHLRKRRIFVHEVMELDRLEAIGSMVFHGLGVSVVPQHFVDDDFPLPLRRVPFGDPPVFRNMGLCEPRKHPKQHTTQRFFDELLRLGKR